MKKVLGIYGSDGGYRFHADKIEFGSIGRMDFDRFIDQSRINLSRIFLAPMQPAQSLSLKTEPFDLIVNYIADMDVNPRTLAMAECVCDAYPDTPVLNHPAAVARSGRHDVSANLQGIEGLIAPRCELVPAGAASAFAAAIEALHIPWPLMIRPIGTQTGRGLYLFESVDELRGHFRRMSQNMVVPAHYVTEYVEHRSPDRLYRKVRYFIVDGIGYPKHMCMSADWPVHVSARGKLMSEREDVRQEERAFLEGSLALAPDGFQSMVGEIKDRLKLDYFGIDLNFTADGQVLVFEANAAMTLVSGSDEPPGFEYMKPATDEIAEAINRLLLADRP